MEAIDNDILQLKSPSNFLIYGCTGSGKTMFVLKLLREWPFQQKLGKGIFFYQIWQDIYKIFLLEFPSIKFVQGFSKEEINDENNWKCKENEVNICITDDLISEVLNEESFSKLFTVLGHHCKITNLLITQNLYLKVLINHTILPFILMLIFF